MRELFKFILLLSLFSVVFLNFVSAFGVGLAYNSQDPLRLFPGESRDIQIKLQSSINEGDLIISPEILEGYDIARIIDNSKEYKVISNQPIGAVINLRVSIPANSSIGEKYSVELVCKDITKRDSGMIGVSSSITSSFSILVVEKSESKVSTSEKTPSENLNLFWWMLIIVIMLAIILVTYLFVRKRD
ncbi:MAG: hypothetical protein WCX73_05880 [Candidatus Pacearchaeota archaeon]|jgi:hypothetical protein